MITSNIKRGRSGWSRSDRFRYNQRETARSHHGRVLAWWRQQMETFSALLAPCVRVIQRSPVNSPTEATDVELWCFLSFAPEQTAEKQSRRWWFETPSRSIWRHCDGVSEFHGLWTKWVGVQICTNFSNNQIWWHSEITWPPVHCNAIPWTFLVIR